MRKTVLLVEADALLLEVLRKRLGREGFRVIPTDSLSKALLEMHNSTPNVILADFQLGDGTALDLLTWVRTRHIHVPVIVILGGARIDLGILALNNGAEQFIPKPVDITLLATMLRRTLEQFSFQQEAGASNLEQSGYVRDPFVGDSQAICELMRTAKRASNANRTILIQGETGTGRSVLARWLHRVGARAKEPFVDLNCAGLSRELFESELFGHQKGAFPGASRNKVGFLEAANHGVLFLDEIGDMDLQVQSKILRVVEEEQFYKLGELLERKTDVQIIASTHRDLMKMAADGGFRGDLYFRISALRLRIPPLRERLQDIPAITDALLDQIGKDMKRGPLRISDDARLTLQRYLWPGNIRELRSVLERAALLSDGEEIDQVGLGFESSLRRDFSTQPAARGPR